MADPATTEAVIVLLQLSAFSSFFEAALGVNLAYGLIRQVHNAGLNYYKKTSENIFRDWESRYCEPVNGQRSNGMAAEHGRVVRDWYKKADGYKQFSTIMVYISRLISYITSVVMLVILAYAGFAKEATIEQGNALILVLAAILPTILFFLFLNGYWYKKIKKLRDEIRVQEGVFSGAERIMNHTD